MRLGTIDEMSVKRPHRKRVKHFHEPGDLHELTFSCYRRLPLLTRKLTVRERPGKTCFRFWQEGPGFDRNLFTPDAIAASIAYIHHNPVARGLCQKAIDWNWSSARYFLCEPPRQQYPDLPFIHGLPVGALDKNKVGM